MSNAIKLDESWKAPLAAEFAAQYMQDLRTVLVRKKADRLIKASERK